MLLDELGRLFLALPAGPGHGAIAQPGHALDAANALLESGALPECAGDRKRLPPLQFRFCAQS